MVTLNADGSDILRSPSADIRNNPITDPTSNVVDLVAQAIARQDDLRTSEANHIREILALREKYDEKLRFAETGRIDSIRAVDVAATVSAAQVQETRATTLANTVALSAEAVRTAQAAATQASVENLTRVIAPIQAAIEDLRRTQYQQQGERAQVTEKRSSNTAVYAAVGVAVSILAMLLTAVGVYLAVRP